MFVGVQFLLYGILCLLLAVFDLIDDFVTRVLPRIGSQQQGYDRTDGSSAQKRKKALTFHDFNFLRFEK